MHILVMGTTGMDELVQELITLVKEFEKQDEVVLVINNEANTHFSQSTLSRALNGKGSQNTIASMCYILKQLQIKNTVEYQYKIC